MLCPDFIKTNKRLNKGLRGKTALLDLCFTELELRQRLWVTPLGPDENIFEGFSATRMDIVKIL